GFGLLPYRSRRIRGLTRIIGQEGGYNEMSDELNYELDTSIDEQALDVEWLQQADLMRKYASYAAATKRYMDELKERLEVERARLDLEIRKDPAKYGIEKVTESAIQSAILMQPEYQELQ